MPLGEFSIICYGFLSDFWRKTQKGSKGKIGQKSGLRRSKGNLCRGEVLRHNKGCLAAARPKGQTRNPQVRCSEAVLFRSEVFHRGNGPIHKGKKFWILFRKPRIHTPIV